jgi:glycine/D-amino acid oxidase-like deaminating enzyme
LQTAIDRLERSGADHFTEGARAVFQAFVASVGGKMRGPIKLPSDETSFWLQSVKNPLAGYQSLPALPQEADVVIVGAGLTGTSAAYHLAGRGKRVVVLEKADPGSGASGKNGGNFELIPENFAGDYGEYAGLEGERRNFLQATRPGLDDRALDEEARRQAEAVMKIGLANSQRMLGIVAREKIDCDLSSSGWLRVAYSKAEEQALEREVALGRSLGLKMSVISAAEIKQRFGIDAKFSGRLAEDNGNYHPLKFVIGEMQAALKKGAELYTRTGVDALTQLADGRFALQTPRGTIVAKQVIMATNAFTSKVLPELKDVQYYQSQILNLEHVKNELDGITFTDKDGDIYGSFPKAAQYRDARGDQRGMLLLGGGRDRPGVDPTHLRRSQSVLDLVLKEAAERFPETKRQPPSRVWTGPMAFTPDRLPAVGFLQDGLIVAAGFNGYGGSYCTEVGALVAEMAESKQTPTALPEDIFGPKRLIKQPAQPRTKGTLQ